MMNKELNPSLTVSIIQLILQLKSIENPYEYEQAQNYLKQMEIESMNFMESQDYNAEGDQVRARIQKHK